MNDPTKPMIDVTRAKCALRAAESFSYFHGLVDGLHDAMYVGADDVRWNHRADAAGDIAVADVMKLAACCDWTDQPETRAVLAELRKNPYRFSEPEGEMPVGAVSEWARAACQKLVSSTDVRRPSESDFAVLICIAHVLGVIWAVTESWGEEEAREVCEHAYLHEAAWLSAAGLVTAADHRALFGGYTAFGLESLSAHLGAPRHGLDVAPSLVLRRYRTAGQDAPFLVARSS